MAKREPFKMTKLLVAYNAIQVVISAIITWQALYHGYLTGTYSLTCEAIDRTRNPAAMRAARSFYWYMLAKFTELLDTVFFVLRKKNNQVSFLHLYHHTGMPIISWVLTKYFPGGHFAFAGMLNSMVHIVMYTYYMIAAMGPKYQKYLWWKKYITSMQMGQFALAFLHFSQLLFFDCGFPRWTILFAMPNAVFFYVLFNDFYQKAYKAKQELKDKENARLLQENNNNNNLINLAKAKDD
uniref:Elongation of very long chain fatty acids protein n=2 Tax=Culicoides sonorensis TaxID=179676 RepID=A0A336MEX6_CULSO